MNGMQTYIKFVVHSDLNDELVYAEFDSKKEAIRYARDYSNEFTYVDKVECFLDPETGRIDEIVSSTTVWTYLDESLEDPQSSTEEEDYWNMMVDQSEPNENDRYDIGDTTWFESLNNLVEDMEENEDMVECKECFDLFPKTDCVKLAFGYICPTCNHGSEVADSDIFKIEFPEYEKFSGPEEEYPTVEVENEPETVEPEMENENDPISTPEEAVPFLVNDEVEAVAGYEKAAEVVADSDLENKEEILDTIDHIKKEEEEHIEELQDLVEVEDDEIVEVENEPISDEAKEVEETAVDVEEELVEHINDRAEPVESDQKLEGTDNAVVDCKVADVVTHSEDEKPVDCEGKKKPLEKPLTEGFTFSLNNEKDLAEFTKLCQEVGIKTVGDLDLFTRESANEPGNILDKLRAYRKELGDDFQIKEAFTKEEQEEFNMDEDGNSLDSYDKYVRCNWCSEIYTKDQCAFEANMGWLCDRCQSAITSRGEKLTIITNPTEEDEAAVLTEAIPMTRDEMIAKEGTDDVDLINAGREEERRVELVEEAEVENEPISNDPGEKPSKPVKMANTASTSGMDFEAACQKYGVTLEGLTEDIDDEDLFAAIWPKTTELGVELLEDRFDKVVDAVTNATGVEISIVINTNNHVNNRWYKANRFEFAKFMLDPAGNSSEDEIEIAKELLIKKLYSMFGHYHYNLTINSEPNNNEVIVARSSESADKARYSMMN